MNITKPSEIAIVDIDNRITTIFSPDIKTTLDLDPKDQILASLLCWLNNFNLEIRKIRNDLNIKIQKMPDPVTVKDLLEITKKISTEEYREIEAKSQDIAIRYRLSENWAFSIMFAVLTNVFMIPPKIDPIRLHIPENILGTDKNSEKISLFGNTKSIFADLEKVKFFMHDIRVKYPAIILTEYVSPTELRAWINSHTKLLKSVQSKLPKRKNVKRESNTIFWGQVAWILKQDGINSWTKMVNKIDEWNEKEPFDKNLNVPSPVEIQKYYKRFIESLISIEKP